MKSGVKIALVAGIVLILLGGGYFVWKSIADKNEANSFAWPVKIADGEKLNISAVYGNRIHPISNIKSLHQGIDIDLNKNREIVASLGGKVELSEWHGGYGNCVVLRHENGLSTLYGHLDKSTVKSDQIVKKGDTIGIAGSTGFTVSIALHFEIRKDGNPTDPELQLPKLANIDHVIPKPASIEKTSEYILPYNHVKYPKVDRTPGFGNRINPVSYKAEFHCGVDIYVPNKAEILATKAGKVIKADLNGGYGNFIEIDHGDGIKSRYGHLEKLIVKAGDKVNIGQVIGLCGSTGYSTGPHLHFEIMKGKDFIDPIQFINSKAK